MLKRKDNLTDLVEQLPKVEVSESQDQEAEQQVADVTGEIVTLGHENGEAISRSTNKSSLELPQGEDVEDLAKAVRSGIRDATEKFFDEHNKNKGKSAK